MLLFPAKTRAGSRKAGARARSTSKQFAPAISCTEFSLALLSDRSEAEGVEGSAIRCSQATSEKCLNHLDNVELLVHDRQRAPLIERQARMADIEANHVSHLDVIAGGDLQVRMLIHQFCCFPMRRSSFGAGISGPVLQRRRRKTRVERRITPAQSDDGLLVLGNRLYVGPDVQSRNQAGGHAVRDWILFKNS